MYVGSILAHPSSLPLSSSASHRPTLPSTLLLNLSGISGSRNLAGDPYYVHFIRDGRPLQSLTLCDLADRQRGSIVPR